MTGTHGAWCGAQTWRTKCPECSEPVFFFHCGCGCKVFFDALGAPWPEHDCETSWTRGLARTRDATGATTVALRPGITVRRDRERIVGDGGIALVAQRRQRKPDPIVSVDPTGAGEIMVVGVVREQHLEVDVGRALRLKNRTALAWALVGRLGRGRWGRVTLHQPSLDADTLHSYTALVPTRVLSGRSPAGDIGGMTVKARLAPYSVPGARTVWLCEQLEVLRASRGQWEPRR